jgi:RsmE family RNA methyltransferase
MNSTHQFAIYSTELTKLLAAGKQFLITHADLHHRIKQVLRLDVGDICILFDATQHATIKIIALDKKSITAELLNIQSNKQLTPHITCFIPLLKRDALAEAIYNATELGANGIQLIITQKVQRPWDGTKELERLQRIIIAAAEQSKHFALPELKTPVALEKALTSLPQATNRLFCDPTGAPLLPLLQEISAKKISQVALMVGPEGDLLPTEKELLTQHQFIFCALTPTILRAPQAVTVVLGSLRSCL